MSTTESPREKRPVAPQNGIRWRWCLRRSPPPGGVGSALVDFMLTSPFGSKRAMERLIGIGVHDGFLYGISR